MRSKRQRERLAQRIREARRQSAGQHSQPRQSRQDEDSFIGFFASDGMRALCDGDACIIAGSQQEMRRIQQRMGCETFTIRGTKFSEILWGLQRGAAYCFDERAYGRFLAPAKKAGLPLEEEDFSDPGPRGMHFVRVQIF